MEESLKFEETVIEEKPKKNKREILSVIFLVLSLVCLMISGFNVNIINQNVLNSINGAWIYYVIRLLVSFILREISIIGIILYGVHLILRKAKISTIIMYGLVALIYVFNLLCAPLLRTVLIMFQNSSNGYWLNLIFGLINLSILVVSLILALTMVLTAKTHKVIKILLIIFISLYLGVLLYKNNYGYMLESYNYHYYFSHYHYVNDYYYSSGAWLTKTLLFSNLFFFLVGDTLVFGVTFIALGIETLIKNKGKAKLFSIAYFIPLVLVVIMLGSDILNFIYQVLIRLLMK